MAVNRLVSVLLMEEGEGRSLAVCMVSDVPSIEIIFSMGVENALQLSLKVLHFFGKEVIWLFKEFPPRD